MVKIKKGDIFKEADLTHLCHQLNCFSTARSGFAGLIRKKYPESLRQDDESEPGDKRKLGTYYIASCHDGKKVVNIYGQYTFGYDGQRHTSYDALDRAFKNLREELEGLEGKVKLGLPYKIGSGLGGACWNVVYQIILDNFEESKIEVVLYNIE
jgi:O-acetyl-ADP-ribose deacetylase (regulator of RNase III)